MSGPVYMHIGAMKTGTSFVQRLMAANRQALLEAGVLFPTRDGRWWLQSAAVRDRTGLGSRGAEVVGAWDELRGQLDAHRGTSVISMEFMSFASPEAARHLVEGLGASDVHVILTVRDGRGLAAPVWQTAARNAGVERWSDFSTALASEPHDPGSPAWRRWQRTQGVPRMLDAWCSVVPPERVHVVVVPGAKAPRSALWDRFASVIGVDPSGFELPRRVNESLGHPSAELARRVNLELGDARKGPVRRASKTVLAHEILTLRRGLEPKVLPTRGLVAFGARWNDTIVEQLERRGVPVVGDLADLPGTPGDLSELPDSPSEPAVDQVLDAAEYALAELSRLAGRDLAAGGGSDPLRDWRAAKDPVSAATSSVVRALVAYAEGRPA